METNERLERIERLLLIQGREALKVSEAALFLGVSESRLRHLASERRVPYYKQGGSTYFKKSELEDWMLGQRIPTNAEIDAEAATRICVVSGFKRNKARAGKP